MYVARVMRSLSRGRPMRFQNLESTCRYRSPINCSRGNCFEIIPPPFFRRKIPILFYPLARNSRNNPPIPVFQKIVCAIKFAIRKYVSIIRSKHVIMIYMGSIQKVNETRYIKKINIESTINRVHILKSISVET